MGYSASNPSLDSQLVRWFYDAVRGEAEPGVFARALKAEFEQIHSEPHSEATQERVQATTHRPLNHPFVRSLADIYRWHRGDLAGNPVELADDESDLNLALNDFQQRGWEEAVLVCLHERIRHIATLGGASPTDEIDEAITYVDHDKRLESIPQWYVLDLLDAVIEQSEDASDWGLYAAQKLCSDWAESLRLEDDYHAEQDFLERAIEMAKARGAEADRERLEERVVSSVDAQVNSFSDSLRRAAVLESALKEFDFVDGEQAEQWAQRATLNNQDARDQFSRISVPIPTDHIEAHVEAFVSAYRGIAENKSRTRALFESFFYNQGLPAGESPEVEPHRDAPLTTLLDTQIIDSEGHPLTRIPGERSDDGDDSMPRDYQVVLQFNAMWLDAALSELINGGDLTGAEFYVLLNFLPINESDHAFLTDAVSRFFARDFVGAYHILNARFEGAVRRVLEAHDIPTSVPKQGGVQSRGFGGLARKVEKIDEPLGRYLRYRYTSKEGFNLRNRTSHSKMGYREVSRTNTTVLLYDVLRACHRIDSLLAAAAQRSSELPDDADGGESGESDAV